MKKTHKSVSKLLVMATVSIVSLGVLQTNATSKPDYTQKIEELLRNEERSKVRVKSEPNVRENYILLLEDQTKNLEKKSDFTSEIKEVKSQLEKIEGLKILSQYDELMIGFSVEIDSSKYEELEKIQQVKKIRKSNVYLPAVTNSKQITQVNEITKNKQRNGEGVVVAVIDTGIDSRHKDFNLTNPQNAKLNQNKVSSIVNSGRLNAVGIESAYKTDKIPYGYNYADDNNIYYNDSKKENDHGTHVAGIVGANGNETEAAQSKAVIGVAPEAQMLAMKVFSNVKNKNGAKADDIIQAIEDSVELGADIINMSLGSVSGFQEETDIEQLAVERAAQKGVVSVISAGNSSNASNVLPSAFAYDESTVGSPSTSSSAISVANFENDVVTSIMLGVDIDGVKKTYKYATPGMQVLLEKQKVKYVGLGKNEDYVNGEVYETVLIKRGDLSFQEKYDNAIAHGAKQVIVFNKDGQGDELISMKINLKEAPALFITTASGNEIVNAISANKSVTMSPEQADPQTQENSRKGKMQVSSSWGPTPNLSLKPEISAPGGNIFSTVANNSYASLSGTSMAAPHVSGALALVYKEIKATSGLSGKDLVMLIKNLVMNSAKPISEDNLNVSVRKQGAGLLQMEKMLNQKVVVTNLQDKAAIELGQINEKEITTKINIKNIDSTEHTYKVSKIDLQESTDKKSITNEISEEKISASVQAENVVLSSNAQKQINLKINMNPSGSEKFVSGFVYLTDEKNNETTIPLIAFYGDFGKQSMFPSLVWEKDKNEYDTFNRGILKTRPTSSYYGLETNYFNTKMSSKNVAISNSVTPGVFDNINLTTTFMRNVQNLEIQVLNSNGNVVNTVNYEGIPKQLLEADSSTFMFPAWNGKINNELAPEGDYVLKVIGSTSVENASKQELLIPMKVDNSGPKVNYLGSSSSENEVTYEWKSNDDKLDVIQARFAINGELVMDDSGQEIKPQYDQTTQSYKISIPKSKVPKNAVIHAISYDAIYNYTIQELVTDAPTPEPTPTPTPEPTPSPVPTPESPTSPDSESNVKPKSDDELENTGNNNEIILAGSMLLTVAAISLKRKRF